MKLRKLCEWVLIEQEVYKFIQIFKSHYTKFYAYIGLFWYCCFFVVVAAFEAGGGVEQVLLRLTAQPGIEPNTDSTGTSNGGATSSAPLPNNVNSDDHLNTTDEVEDSKTERDKEMEDELSADIAKADALADYDIEVNVEGEAITEYLALLQTASH